MSTGATQISLCPLRLLLVSTNATVVAEPELMPISARFVYLLVVSSWYTWHNTTPVKRIVTANPPVMLEESAQYPTFSGHIYSPEFLHRSEFVGQQISTRRLYGS